MSKILLIGNGPSVLENKFGDKIDGDEYDLVCRINRGHRQDNGEVNTQFKENVGERCDIWFCSDLRTNLAIERKKDYNQIFIYCPEFKYNESLSKEINSTYPNITILPKEIEQEVNKICNFKPSWPSTGVIAIHYLFLTGDEVTIHGFDTYDFKYDTLHYFEDKPNKYKLDKNSDHLPKTEKDYLNFMIGNKNIKLLQ